MESKIHLFVKKRKNYEDQVAHVRSFSEKKP